MDFPLWQLHRGYWQEGIRENTMEAFRQAKAKGAQMVEMDIQISGDGVPHVFHDFDLKKFFHVDQKVNRTPSDDLEALNIPTLEEVLQSEDIPSCLNLEIKTIDFIAYGATRPIVDVIRQSDSNKTLLFSSFHPMALHWCSRLMPELPRALIVGSAKALMSWLFGLSVKLAAPNFINCRYGLIDEDLTRNRLLSFEKPIMVWTVNDYNKAAFYIERGARSIISDLAPPPSN